MSEASRVSATIAQLRRPHPERPLDEHDLDPDPIEQFARWMKDALAAGIELPNAMTVATADKDGKPSARTVLLKGFDRDGFVFFTNYDSRKGRDLDANPNAALLFHWRELERQVTVLGTVRKVSRSESEEYFATRPRASRIAAWASRQSEVIEGRTALEERFAAADVQCGADVSLPPFWGGYRLLPETIELWQARPNRMHDRLRYRRSTADGWVIERLAP